MDSDDFLSVFFVILLLAFLGLVVGLSSYESGRSGMQREAIEAGVGRWEVNQKTGDKKFVYGPPKEMKP